MQLFWSEMRVHELRVKIPASECRVIDGKATKL